MMKSILNITRTEQVKVLYDGVDWKLFEDDRGVLRLHDMINNSHVLINADDLDELLMIKSIIKDKYRDHLKYS